MSRTHHPRPTKRTPGRHACDLVVHLDNALRSAAHVIQNSADPLARIEAETLERELLTLRESAIQLRKTAQRPANQRST